MSKPYRTAKAPPGAEIPARNTRLYGSHEEQVATAALRSRGVPSPDRAYVPARPRAELRVSREVAAHAANLQRAQTAMLQAQRAVRSARQGGADRRSLALLAHAARTARATYLRLTGGVESREIAVSLGSDTSRIRAI